MKRMNNKNLGAVKKELHSSKIKNRKGITLVALVVTIIVLLILAGVSIMQLTESGLFEKTKLAKEKQESAEQLENATLADYENKIGEYVGEISRDTVTIDKEEYEELKRKGTWELLATSTTTTENEYQVSDLSKYSFINLIAYTGSSPDWEIRDVTRVPYSIFSGIGSGKIFANYYGGNIVTGIAQYVSNSSVKIYCATSYATKVELYGEY